MNNTKVDVKEIYHRVVTDVIDGVREAFLDEGIDEQVLHELQQLWESKVAQSKALETESLVQTSSQHIQQQQQQQQQQQYQQQQQALAHQRASAVHHHPQPVTAHQVPQPAHRGISQVPMQGQMVAVAVRPGSTAQNISLPAGAYGQQFQQYQLLVHPNDVMQTPSHAQYLQRSTLQPMLNVGQTYNVTQPGMTSIHTQNMNTQPHITQLDGLGDTSSESENDVGDDDEDDDDEEPADEAHGDEEDPLNSADDVSDADPTEVFDAENVVVCQFDKINRSKNRWKFKLKDGIMNLGGRDMLFQMATGDAEW